MDSTKKKIGWQFWAFLAACTVGGYFLGKSLANAAFRFPEWLGTASVIAIAISCFYALIGIISLLGTLSPRTGVNMEMYEDEVEWQDERPLIGWSAVGLMAFGAILPLMLLVEPFDRISSTSAIMLGGLLVIVSGYATWRVWAQMDELWRDLSKNAGNIGFYMVLLVGGAWAFLAHLGVVAPLSPLGWANLIFSSTLLGTVAASRWQGL